ncbi:subtilisin-type proteinase [Streptomyces himastatinicus ATCC 53653]|uniref:Subtilisin-type proteinase n=1 Tax=Streptomyces himastatinicus ATCC 53653 TaxID=457427 RepID=D9WBS8_9ACTN|nr:subtilisin-type proteinase [Streptomyces himastatinicus ATCC 53653]
MSGHVMSRHPFAGRAGAVIAAMTLALATPAAASDAAASDSDSGALHDSEWALTALKAERAWKFSKGAGVTVAVVGTGVDATHPDLRGRVAAGKDFAGGGSPVTRDDGNEDEQSTHAAGIIVGTGRNYRGDGVYGLAPRARVMPLGVYRNGKPQVTATARAIRHAASHGAHIIHVAVSFKRPSADLKSAVKYAAGQDAVVVAGAGDNGKDGNKPTYPAALPGVVAVVATDKKGAVWTSSHHGGTITLAAPGVAILTTAGNNDYWTGDGTGYAAPWVAAGAALLRSEHPRWNSRQIVRKLIDTADRKGSAGHDPRYGYGVIAPAKALADRAAPPPSAEPTVAPSPHRTKAAAASEAAGDTSALVTIGVVAAVLVVLAVLAVVLISRRRPPPGNSHNG